MFLVIDVTTVETTKILAKADIRCAQVLGQYYKLKGRKVVGPPVAGSSFSVFPLEQLQYLFWNTFEQPPSDSYKELIQNCLKMVDDAPENIIPLKELEKMVDQLRPEEIAGYVEKPKKKAAVKREPGSRPASGTTTGTVWDLCDELKEKLGRMPERKEVMQFCKEEAGVHPSTASTQFAKWKKSL